MRARHGLQGADELMSQGICLAVCCERHNGDAFDGSFECAIKDHLYREGAWILAAEENGDIQSDETIGKLALYKTGVLKSTA